MRKIVGASRLGLDLCALLASAVEQNSTGKVKTIAKYAKFAVYFIMTIRIIVAIYAKVSGKYDRTEWLV